MLGYISRYGSPAVNMHRKKLPTPLTVFVKFNKIKGRGGFSAHQVVCMSAP